jgi:ABC-2 type transport system ATP-binding protein
VPQLLSADGALTGYKNLLFSARLYLIPRRQRQGRIRAALERMGLTEAADRLVQSYSGGMIRRLEIAQSMIHEPPVLFMDEPTVGLDPAARLAVWDHVRQLKETLGTTILVTTHLMEEADEVCDRIGVLHAGKLEETGTPEELKARLGPGATLNDVFTSCGHPGGCYCGGANGACCGCGTACCPMALVVDTPIPPCADGPVLAAPPSALFDGTNADALLRPPCAMA